MGRTSKLEDAPSEMSSVGRITDRKFPSLLRDGSDADEFEDTGVGAHLFDEFDGQADDVGKAAIEVFDVGVAAVLNAVSAGFAFPQTACQIALQRVLEHGLHGHCGGFVADQPLAGCDVQERHAGDDVMRRADECVQNAAGVVDVGGFADDLVAK